MSLETQDDIMLALSGLYPDGYDGFPAGADTPQSYADYESMTLTPGAIRHTEAELEAGREAYDARQAVYASINDRRAGIAASFAQAPPFLRGPYRGDFRAASEALDEGDYLAALAIVQYVEPVAGFDEDQIAAFSAFQTSAAGLINEMISLAATL